MIELKTLKTSLVELESVAVAFSGGVDSTLLLHLSHRLLGERCVAVTAYSALSPLRELNEASEFCRRYGIEQVILERDELAIPGFCDNPPERCYLCKRDLLGRIRHLADERGIAAVIEGSNLDDDDDYRPGMQAVRELGVLSPLRDAGLSKTAIRRLSKEFGLPTSDKPSMACLATRFPYYEEITLAGLARVEKAEQWLLDQGIKQVRVRSHSDVARIEVERDSMELFTDREFREQVHEALIAIGFKFVSLDLMGYRSGSMNTQL